MSRLARHNLLCGGIAPLAKSMFVQFISPQGQSWCLFRVHASHGELLRTTGPASAIDSTPLSVAVEALFLTII